MKVVVSRYGAKGVLLTWAARIDETILNEMTQFIRVIQQGQDDISDIHHAYHEVLIQYKRKIDDFQSLHQNLKNILHRPSVQKRPASTLWTVPVCYDDTLAPDLTIYLEQKGLALEDLVSLHTKPIYTVYFIGFLPGFLYLGGLESTLALNRKTKPSRLIQKGTVAIGGMQTGIYPQDSPGGWYGIGYTPLSFFEPHKTIPTWAKTGDKIQFESVNKETINRIQNEISKDVYSIKSEPYER